MYINMFLNKTKDIYSEHWIKCIEGFALLATWLITVKVSVHDSSDICQGYIDRAVSQPPATARILSHVVLRGELTFITTPEYNRGAENQYHRVCTRDCSIFLGYGLWLLHTNDYLGGRYVCLYSIFFMYIILEDMLCLKHACNSDLEMSIS